MVDISVFSHAPADREKEYRKCSEQKSGFLHGPPQQSPRKMGFYYTGGQKTGKRLDGGREKADGIDASGDKAHSHPQKHLQDHCTDKMLGDAINHQTQRGNTQRHGDAGKQILRRTLRKRPHRRCDQNQHRKTVQHKL